MANNNDVVVIELDRPRILRFGHKALKTYQAISGKPIEELGQGGFDFAEIERLVYCGLLSDGRANGDVLTMEQLEDLLDEHDIQDTIEKMTEALNKSFGKGDNPNEQVTVRKKK